MVAAAVIGGAVIGGVASNAAAKKGAQSQQDATNASLAEQGRQFDLTRADYAPYREAGTRALGQLQTDINQQPTSAEVMAQPGYQFGLQQGQTAIDRKIAAMGGRVSGAAIKQAGRYGTDYATTGYNAEYQRRQDRLNRLQALAGIGQTATNGSAAAGANSTNAISGLISSQGDSTAASQIARGNIWANTGNQIAALYGRNYQRTPSVGLGSDPNGYNGTMNNFSAYVAGGN